jgi:hypothetical protein
MTEKPIPSHLMPTPIGAKPIGQDSEILRRMAQALQDEEEDINDMTNTDVARAPAPPFSPPAPRPVAPGLPNYTPPTEQPVDIQFNGKRLQVKAIVTNKAEIELLIGSLTALKPFISGEGDA